jgi:predicted secreted protein
MTITAALVMYAVSWFMTFFVVLQIHSPTQADVGSVVPGTPRGAPAGFIVKRKAWITTIFATVIWAILCAIIISGVISVRDFDWMGRMPPVNAG